MCCHILEITSFINKEQKITMIIRVIENVFKLLFDVSEAFYSIVVTHQNKSLAYFIIG